LQFSDPSGDESIISISASMAVQQLLVRAAIRGIIGGLINGTLGGINGGVEASLSNGDIGRGILSGASTGFGSGFFFGVLPASPILTRALIGLGAVSLVSGIYSAYDEGNYELAGYRLLVGGLFTAGGAVSMKLAHTKAMNRPLATMRGPESPNDPMWPEKTLELTAKYLQDEEGVFTLITHTEGSGPGRPTGLTFLDYAGSSYQAVSPRILSDAVKYFIANCGENVREIRLAICNGADEIVATSEGDNIHLVGRIIAQEVANYTGLPVRATKGLLTPRAIAQDRVIWQTFYPQAEKKMLR
jgi:hypothetical protein